MIGRTLSHYEIIDQLGAGGMGEVYLARDVTLGRKVALKVLPNELAEDPARLARLQREAKVLAALDHPGVVTVFSVEEAEGIHFLTMAYVEGRTLDQLIPPQGMAVGEWFSLALALSDALRAAHERGIIHRDLKPTNVMVDDDGRLRLLDFGLARVEEAVPMSSRLPTATMDDAVTRQGVVLGTIPYMSPEQAEGKRLDARSDLFSLGVVLYEMATGSRPFRGENPASLTSSILRDEPPSVQSLRPELPEAVAAVIRRCLEKDPERRYQTARDLRDELEALRAGELSGTALKHAEQSRPVWRRWVALAGAAAVVVFAGMVAVGVWRGDKAATEAGSEGTVEAVAPAVRSIAVLPLRNMSGDPGQEYFVDGMTEALITGLSKIEALRVIARSSVMPFKGGDTPLAEIAAALGVDAVVEGSVLREGEQVGITAELIDVASERVLWGEHYRRDLTSILALQAEMATAIADEIHVALSPEDEARLTGTETVDAAAYDAVLKGLFNLQQFTPRGFDAALLHFETAIGIDPGYAPAYVGVSRVWGYRAQMGLLRPRETAAIRREMITRALELSPSLPDAHLDLATFRTWYEWDWQGGEEAFLRAIELNPSSAEARIFYAHLLTILGRGVEGTAQAERALELDPLNPFFQALAGVQYLMVGRNEEGVAQLRHTLEENPSLGFGHDNLWDVYHRRGMADEALVEATAYFTLAGDPEAVEALERGWEEGGYRGAMIGVADLFEGRAEAAWVQPIALVLLEDYAGRPERVFPWLEKAFEQREPNLPYVGTRLWSLPEVRTDSRFKDLLRRLGVPDQMRGPPAGSEE